MIRGRKGNMCNRTRGEKSLQRRIAKNSVKSLSKISPKPCKRRTSKTHIYKATILYTISKRTRGPKINLGSSLSFISRNNSIKISSKSTRALVRCIKLSKLLPHFIPITSIRTSIYNREEPKGRGVRSNIKMYAIP